MAWLVPVRAVRREVVELGRQVLGGAWTAREVEAQMGSAIRRAESAGRGGRVMWQGRALDPRYRFRTATIIDWLGISEEEQRELKVLVGSAVLSERQAARGRASGHARREANRERDARILELRFVQGLSIRRIAAVMGFPHTTVQSVLERGSEVYDEPV